MQKTRRIQLIFLVYWIMLGYMIAALIWWFIALSNQNDIITQLKINEVAPGSANFEDTIRMIEETKQRKTTQYAAEGLFFLLLIVASAIYVYRAVNRQFKHNLQQQHFMMAITHELKTPIAVTQLNLETLLKRNLNEEQQHRLITNTIQEAIRLNALCNNILLTSQFEAGGYRMVKEELDLSNLFKACINDFRNRYPARFIESTVENNIFVQGDELLLQMAMNNLMDNAIKYSPKEGVIRATLASKNGVDLMVADEGEGIRQEESIKVFEKFYRVGNEATRKAKGTGLGLYLTARIVKAHGGTVKVEENIPRGCRFVIHLPGTN